MTSSELSISEITAISLTLSVALAALMANIETNNIEINANDLFILKILITSL